MNMKKFLERIATVACVMLLLNSCIQDEAPNTECDILQCSVPDDILVEAVKIDNYTVSMKIRPDVDISKIAPEFVITDGATIEPASGSVQDFLNAKDHTIYYTVTSQDGKWSKSYPVKVSQKEIPSEYNYNNNRLDPNNKYTILSEIDADNEVVMTWASGNPGYVLCGVADVKAKEKYGKEPADYQPHIWEFFPTVPVYGEDKGIDDVDVPGNVEMRLNVTDGTTYFVNPDGTPAVPTFLRLETRSTGSFGKTVKMPIAAGNLFQGIFDLGLAIKNPRGATKFGEPYRYNPTHFTGAYRYKRGDVFTDKYGKVVEGRLDMFSIYAIFYLADTGNEATRIDFIDGEIHINNFQHPNLVSVAMVKDAHVSNDWVTFDVPFEVAANAPELDPSGLAMGKYKIGIVISSSVDGDQFEGAVGSILDVKDLKVHH